MNKYLLVPSSYELADEIDLGKACSSLLDGQISVEQKRDGSKTVISVRSRRVADRLCKDDVLMDLVLSGADDDMPITLEGDAVSFEMTCEQDKRRETVAKLLRVEHAVWLRATFVQLLAEHDERDCEGDVGTK